MSACCGKKSGKRRENKNSEETKRIIGRQRLMETIDSLRRKLDRDINLKNLQINAVNKRLKQIDLALNQLDQIRHQDNQSIDQLLDKILKQGKNFVSWYPTEESTEDVSGPVHIQPTTYQIGGTDSLPILSDKKEQLVLEDIKNTICPICQEPITDMGLTKVCNHVFCIVCIRQWIEQHNSCPLCRQVIEEILVITQDMHQNDFDRIVVENNEIRDRKKLMERCMKVKNYLVVLRQMRVDHISDLYRKMRDINLSKTNLDKCGNKTNKDIEDGIDAVLDLRKVLRSPFDWTVKWATHEFSHLFDIK